MPVRAAVPLAKEGSSGPGVMTVAHFRTPFLHFSETFIYGLLDNFSRRVRSIAFTRDPVHLALFPFPRIVDYSFPRFSLSWAIDNVARRIFGRHDVLLEKAVRDRGVQLIHAHFGEEGYWLLNVKKRLKLPLLTTFYGYDLSELLVQDLWKRRYLDLFREGDLFLVEGGHMKRVLVRAGCPEEKVRIQRIGINLEKIPFQERRPPSGKTIFLFCGRFVEKKGLIYALRACDRLVREGAANFELRVIGDGPLQEEAEGFVRDRGLEGHVRFLGRKPHAEFYRLLSEAHVYLAPSVTAANGDSEGGAPTTLLEAQAAGLPVVASRHADIPEVMVEGKSGLLSDERDDVGLAANMRFLMEHPEQWPAFGRAGREHVRAQHDVKKTAAGLEDVYAGLVRAYGLEKPGPVPPFYVLPEFFRADTKAKSGAPAGPSPDSVPAGSAPSGDVSRTFSCPWCRAEISRAAGGGLLCGSCGRGVGRVEDGTFLFGDAAEAVRADPLLDRLTESVRSVGSRHIYGSLYKDLTSDELDRVYSFLSIFHRGAWRFFSNLSKEKIVLSIESGVGSASYAAAPFASKVFVLHPGADAAKAIAQQSQRMKHKNIVSVSVGKADRLPFPDGSFDIVAVHGLGRILGASPREGVWAAERIFLEEVRRVLKPEGSLYLERRVSHPGWRISLMSALALASIRRTLTAFGLRWKLYLGFSDAGPYSYKITDLSRVKSMIDGLKRFLRMFLGAGRVGIMAAPTESDLKSVWLKRLANDFLASPNENMELHLGSAGVYRVHGKHCIVRIPSDWIAYIRCATNMIALKKLGRLGLSFPVPFFLADDELDGQPFFVESRLRARDIPYMKLSAAESKAFAGRAVGVLAELHQKTLERPELDKALFSHVFSVPLEKVRACVDGETAGGLEAFERLLRQRALDKPIDLVMVHGDFKITNVLLCSDHRTLGLFDWDLSQPLGLPGIDLVIYKGFDVFLEKKHSYTQAIYEAGFESEGDADVRRYRELLGVDDFWWNVQCLMALVHYFLYHAGEEKRRSPAWCQENISPFLRKACGRVLGRETAVSGGGIT